MSSREFTEWLIYWEWKDYFTNKGAPSTKKAKDPKTSSTLGKSKKG